MAGNLYEQGYYETGTASITQGQTVVTGQGTAWSQIVRPADDFGKHVGMPIPIASVDSDTQITLAFPWPGPTQTAAPYRVTFTPYHVAYRQALQEIGQLLSSGNVSALAGLVGGANKLPFFDGTGTMDQTGLSAFMRTLLNDADGPTAYGTLGTVPNAQISNSLTPDKAFRRGNVLGTVSQSGGVPTGAIIERGNNANGFYTRYADGTVRCGHYIQLTGISSSEWRTAWSFPSQLISVANRTISVTPDLLESFPDISITDRNWFSTTSARNNSTNSTDVSVFTANGSPIDPVTQPLFVFVAVEGRWF